MRLMAPVLTALAASLSTVALSAGCRAVHGEARPTPRPVKVMEARAPESAAGARYAVSIQPYEQIPLSFKASGYVDSMLRRSGADGRSRPLQAGDFVRAGTVVARVREADFRERVNQAASSVRELEVAQRKAQIDLDRAHYLFAAGAMTKPDRDLAQTAFDQNAARMAAAKAQLKMAEIALGESALVAPASGVILERKIEVGALVSPGTVGFMLGDVSAVKAVFGVPDSIVHRVAPGQPLIVTTEAFHGVRFQGRVTTIAPSADSQTRVFDIEVTIPNADGRLRPGMIGSVEFGTEAPLAAAAPTAAAVPLSAIVRSPKSADEYSVFVVDGQGEAMKARARTVALGPVQGNLVGVTRGLKAGEKVVVMGAGLVVDGEPVRVIP